MQRDVPGLVGVPLPPELTDNPLADRLALFIMSEQGQAILARHGFKPVGLAD